LTYSSGSFTNTLDYPQTLSYNCAAVSGEFETPTWLQIVRTFKSLQVCKQGVLKAVVQGHHVSGHAWNFEYAILGSPPETEETVHIIQGS